MLRTTAAAVLLGLSAFTLGAGEIAPIARKLPPPGVEVPAADVQKLTADLQKVSKRIAALATKAEIADVLADVQVYEKAIHYALINDEFYVAKPSANAKPGSKPASNTPRGIAICGDLLKTANTRLDALEKADHPWTTAKGQIVRGYLSAVDGSPQPYGLEIPDDVDLSKPTPLYVWLHGRGDEETDLYFIKGREGKRGQFQPKGAIVVNVFGRHCVGYKSAGEVDVFEAIESIKKRYKIDENRIVLAGFSMGGAGAWHLGAHYADRFCVVHTGAGFVDVKNYQNITPDKMPPPVEQKLWGVYDVPDYVHNLFNVPVVSYSGEIDKQRASAELMAKVFKQEGRELTHLIGPGVPHKYEPKTLIEVLKQIDAFVQKGRDPLPKHVELQTRTLRYNKMFWVEALGLGEHWADARVDATASDMPQLAIAVKTTNVTGLRLGNPFSPQGNATNDRAVAVTIDDATLSVPLGSFSSGNATFWKREGKWSAGPDLPGVPAKRPGLQGPIDDAFMSSFLFVAPTGKSSSAAVQEWTQFEMKHQQDRWRLLMRGDVRIKKDTDVTTEDVQKYNLILWGDPKSNKMIATIAAKLPVKWNGNKLQLGGKTYDPSHTVPALIYPNPQNPAKYVVLNSGVTFREIHDSTNSLQNPKHGDWVFYDINSPPNSTEAGKVYEEGFFDENWQVKR